MNKDELTEYADDLLHMAICRCDSLSDAQDLAQETLLAALNTLQQGKTIENLQSWLITVMNRKYYDILRQRYRKPTVCIDVIEEIAVSDELYFDDAAADAENIRRCLTQLTKIYREAIIQYYMYGRSVKQISDTLGIPENTVKSRLDAGRKHIRKEFSMENYTRQSYEPETLGLTCSGQNGINGEPFSVVGTDKIAMNLLILAYNEPLTIPELAKAIGISTTYIEPIVDRLVQNELMKRSSDKIYTDFIIYSEKDRTANLHLETALADKLYAGIWEIMEKGLSELREQDFYQKQTPAKQHKLESFFAVMTMQSATNEIRNAAGGDYRIFEQYPDRPNGGKWIVMGDKYPANYDYDACPYSKYAVSGECLSTTSDIFGLKKLSLCDYDTDDMALGKTHRGYQPDDRDTIAKMLYAIHLDDRNLLAVLSTHALEKTDELIAMNYLSRSTDGTLKLAVPLITLNDRQRLLALSNKCHTAISNTFHDTLMQLMTNPVKLPKHLKSVPEWQRYMWCCTSFPMAVIIRAREHGLFLKDVAGPVPAVMLCYEA